MFVGLLKCTKGRLEDMWYGIPGTTHFHARLNFVCVACCEAEREGVYLWPALSNLEVIGKKLTVNRLNLKGWVLSDQ